MRWELEERPTPARDREATKDVSIRSVVSPALDRLHAAEENLLAAKAEFESAKIAFNAAVSTSVGAGWRVTRRQKEVLQMLCNLKTNKQIAQELNVSERTVKFHVSALLDKFGVDSRHQIRAIAEANQSKEKVNEA